MALPSGVDVQFNGHDKNIYSRETRVQKQFCLDYRWMRRVG